MIASDKNKIVKNVTETIFFQLIIYLSKKE